MIDSTVSKKPLILAAIVLVGIAAIVVWLVTRPSPEPPVEPGGGEQPVANLETYQNQKYNYSFKYPKGWSLDLTYADKDLTSDAGEAFLILSSKQNPMALLTQNKAPADLNTLTLSIYPVAASTKVDDFIKDKKYSIPLSQIDVSFGGLRGTQLLYVYPKDQSEILNIMTILKKDTQMLVFSWMSPKPDKDKLPETVATIHDEILKSLEIK